MSAPGIPVLHGSLHGSKGHWYGRQVGDAEPGLEAERIAAEARDRVRFEEEALELADQVYRVARRLVRTPEEA